MKLERLVSIIMVLLQRRRVEAKELAGMFEVSLRTVYRDIEALNMAGIPIVSTPGVGGGFAIMDTYKVDKQVFTPDDLTALLMGLKSIASVGDKSEVSAALAKIKSLVPAERARAIELKSSQIIVDLTPWLDNAAFQPLLEIIKVAIAENRLLHFKYCDRAGRESVRTAEPYNLLLKANNWYLHAYCRTKQDARLFKLLRMRDWVLTAETFAPRDLPPGHEEFARKDEYRAIVIKLKAHKSLWGRLLSFCSHEDLTETTDGYLLADYLFMPDDFGYSKLLSFGDRCECLGPPEVRAELIRRIEALRSMYSEASTDGEVEVSVGKGFVN